MRGGGRTGCGEQVSSRGGHEMPLRVAESFELRLPVQRLGKLCGRKLRCTPLSMMQRQMRSAAHSAEISFAERDRTHRRPFQAAMERHRHR